METGEVSEKIKRGRHTTRHSELIRIEKDTYVLDTPGFSSLFIHMFEEDEIKDYFQEFAPYEDECRFQGCSHTHEPDCGVKKALEEGKISNPSAIKGIFRLIFEIKNAAGEVVCLAPYYLIVK